MTDPMLLTPGEVASLFRVDPKTVTRWAKAGRIGSVRTPGGHTRYRKSEVQQLLDGGVTVRVEPEPQTPLVLPTAPPPEPRPAPPQVDRLFCPKCKRRRSFEHDEVCR